MTPQISGALIAPGQIVVESDVKKVQRPSGGVVGEVRARDGMSRVSPDMTTDQRNGQSHYTIRVSMPPEQVARLGKVTLIPGMPVEAFVQTGDRTLISYFMKPLSDQLMRAFREQVNAWPWPRTSYSSRFPLPRSL